MPSLFMQAAVRKDVLDGLYLGLSAWARRVLAGYEALVVFTKEAVTVTNMGTLGYLHNY
jgi:hypothetical protein